MMKATKISNQRGDHRLVRNTISRPKFTSIINW
jgi:hypothetical protein